MKTKDMVLTAIQTGNAQRLKNVQSYLRYKHQQTYKEFEDMVTRICNKNDINITKAEISELLLG